MKIVTKKLMYIDFREREKIQIYLTRNHLSQNQLAKKLGFSISLMSAMMNGDRSINPKFLDFLVSIKIIPKEVLEDEDR